MATVINRNYPPSPSRLLMEQARAAELPVVKEKPAAKRAAVKKTAKPTRAKAGTKKRKSK